MSLGVLVHIFLLDVDLRVGFLGQSVSLCSLWFHKFPSPQDCMSVPTASHLTNTRECQVS